MFCPRCGVTLPDGAGFCSSCGAQLGGAPGDHTPPPVQPRRRSWVLLAVVIAASVAVIVGCGTVAWLMLFSPYEISEDNFPDPYLRVAVSATYDEDGDGKLSREEGRAVTEMKLSGCKELEGLGRIFPNIERIEVTGGSLERLNTSDLPELAAIDVREEPLEELDVSNNHELSYLYVSDETEVSGIDETGLREVWLSLDVTENIGGSSSISHNERDAYGRIVSWRFESAWDTASASYTYDDEGRPVHADFDYVQNTVTYEDYEYDEQGRLVRKSNDNGYTEFYYEGSELPVGAASREQIGYSRYTTDESYEYDSDGRITLIDRMTEDRTRYWFVFEYDFAGNIVMVESWYANPEADEDVLSYRMTYYYDGDGNMVRTSFEGENIYFCAPSEFVYDDEGRVVSAHTDGTEMMYAYSATYEYDEEGLLVAAEMGERSYEATYTRRFLPRDAEDPAAGFSLIVYKGSGGTEVFPLVGVTNPNTGIADPVTLPTGFEDTYRGY